jgi:hypothetical protein
VFETKPDPTLEKHLSGVLLYGWFLSSLTDIIKLGWKRLPGTNPLAYYIRSYITAIKVFTGIIFIFSI